MATADRPPNSTDEGVGDRDLDVPRARRPRRGPGTSLHVYQRLIANPFLAALGLVAWYGALRTALEARSFGLFAATFPTLMLVPLLLQFHCLDCGATGRLSRWRDHACDRVEARRLTGKRRRLRGPTPASQTVLWCFAVAVVSFLAWIASG